MHLKNVIKIIALAATSPTTTAIKYEIGKTGIDFIDQKTGIILAAVMGVVSIWGIIQAVKNWGDLWSAIGERDASTMKSAGLSFVGSVMMAGVGIILGILGLIN